ncbi:hypothetical protein [Kribbella jiaozuonensis]|uniref:Uncharacterized protein n=1 Tax=Kribbella jiaozuonensis TaxID=2575441 RepID=A0A4U3LW48_9ACTN|nr:hypothetical protein [Kribbella jiaozuonensis]TKK80130.1 hypothetical protein FDA38_17495 [Kribbella jiaozuonensis]
MALAGAILDDASLLDRPQDLGALVPEAFQVAHGLTGLDVVVEIEPLRAQLSVLAIEHLKGARLPLIQLDQIDTFARVSEVPPSAVMDLCPLDLLEDDVERMIATVIGEPFRQKDWGGELDDLFTQSVQLDGRAVRASFMLKGRGLGSVMKMKDLGANGDQVMRMVRQPAELFVVQHVNRIDASVYSHLEDAIVARRAEGHEVVGSVWDGVAVARLGVAYGLMDPKSGQIRTEALRTK